MSQTQIDQLIIKHISDLEAAYQHALKLNNNITEQLCNICKDFCENNKFICEGEYNNDEESLCFFPEEWIDKNYEYERIASFHLEYRDYSSRNEDAGDEFWITTLCCQGNDSLVIRFQQSALTKSNWRKFLRSYTSAFENSGFKQDDKPSLYLPFCIEPEALSAALEDDNWEQGLENFRKALDITASALPVFQTIVNQLKIET